jgi:hypothetical protein
MRTSKQINLATTFQRTRRRIANVLAVKTRLLHRSFLHFFFYGFLLVSVSLHLPAQAEQANSSCARGPTPIAEAARCIADDIATQLNEYATNHGSLRHRIALYEFGEQNVPIDLKVAGLLASRVVSELKGKLSRSYALVTRQDLTKIIDDAYQLGRGDPDNPIAVISSAGEIDFLVIGELTRVGENISATFRAHKTVGEIEIVASSSPVSISGLFDTSSNIETLNAFRTRVAEYFHDATPNLKIIRLDGIGFEKSGLSTGASDYVEEEIVEEMVEKFRNVISGRALRFERSGLEEPEDSSPGSYAMSGEYWLRNDSIKLRIRLSNRSGERSQVSGFIRLEDLPANGLRPAGSFGPIAQNQLGAVSLRITSSKGRHPTYKVGEKFSFNLYADRDVHLYCFYLQADQNIIKIFPNVHHPSSRIAGRKRHSIPGDIFPFVLDVQPPTGIELLKCFAVLRDIESDLPADLTRNSSDILPRRFRETLTENFRGIERSGLTEASLAINIRGRN